MQSVLAHLKVGFDLDGVLAQTDTLAVEWYKLRGLVPEDASAEDITQWNHSACWPSVTDDHTAEMFRDPDFFGKIPPDMEACGLVRELSLAGAEIHIVTHRDWRPENRTTTVWWLKHWGIPYDRLEFCKGDAKPHYAARFDLDFFFEDHPQTAYWLAHDIRFFSFLRDKPYNRSAAPHEKLLRFYQWNEIRAFFRL